ncbi:hypothetical protein LWI29_013100 [Acer saccharum]|uniref:SKI-interacting protein SKIP SNW domain-containing protein n=1 Tax=Acer saccharum TaxID=4024 RepID=A0AA39TBB0_ACESA|nr:hypothetical protein LWI29_013100 [Acer saccharum]
MVMLKDILPPVKASNPSLYDHSSDPWFKSRYSTSSEAERSTEINHKPVPPYLNRQGFIPRKIEDFGDGGAFPEIHIAQYPLDMVKQNENAKKIVHSQLKDLIPKILMNDEESEEDEEEEKQREIDEITQETKAALKKIVNVKLSAAQPKNVPQQSQDSKMVEKPVDYKNQQPVEPPKFKHKRVPKASGSPPVPIMHSPPRPVTVKDQQDWIISPCISNWKNPKGYTIPLDKRLAADGRGLQEVQI